MMIGIHNDVGETMHRHDGIERSYLKKGSVVMLMSVILGFIAEYGFNVVLSRTLSAHLYGDYKVAYAFAALAGVLVLLGGDRLAPKVLSAPLLEGDHRLVRPFLIFYIKIALGLSGGVIMVTVLASVFHVDSFELDRHHPLMLMSFVIPLIAIGALLSRILQSARQIAVSNLPWRIALPLMKALGVVFLSLLVVRVELWQVIAIGAGAVGVIILWQWKKIRAYRLIGRHDGVIQGRTLLQTSVPMMFVMLMVLGLNHLDLMMLELLGDEKEVGYFAAATTIAHILPVAQVTITALFLPLITPAMLQGTSEALLWKGTRMIAGMVFALALGLMVLGPMLLALFGSDFQQGRQVLYYLVFGYSLWAIVAWFSTWLQYTGKGKQVAWVSGVALVLDGVCNGMLIPHYGMEGAALATLIALGSGALMMATLFHRSRKGDTSNAPEASG